MEFDPLILSRIQFAFTVSFHILFPAFTVGLASWIVVLEAMWLRTGSAVHRALSEFWTKIFAISFGMGVVSGIVMSYQFGTNWSVWSDRTGFILGALIQYEVVTAFFLEAAFLGILLFGRDRVPRPMHFLAAVAVALGTLLSSFWILSANSFMHTPAGFVIGPDGRLYVESWWDVIFNPSFPYRLGHTVTAFFLTTAFVVAAISASYLLRGVHRPHARIGYSMALGMITVLGPWQVVMGDLHGLNTLDHQPAKIAAMEGHWEGGANAPLILFAIPDREAETNHYEIAIPGLSSLILTHTLEGEVPGLKQFAPADRPPVEIVFFTFRIMVGIGLLMAAIGLFSLYLRVRGRLWDTRWFMRLVSWTLPIGFIAILCGWFTTEIGRQPWTVYGVLRTTDSVTPSLTGDAAFASLMTYIVVYAVIFTAGTYYIIRQLRIGPADVVSEKAPAAASSAGHPKRPLSRPDEAFEPGTGD